MYPVAVTEAETELPNDVDLTGMGVEPLKSSVP